MKNAYSFHPTTGVFIGVDFAQESPLEPGVFLLPAGATFVEPPQVAEGKQATWDGKAWAVTGIPLPAPEPEPGLVLPELQTSQPEPEPEPEPLTWDTIRAQRNFLLAQSDWTQLADAPLTQEQKTAWSAYRQALRDVPSSFSTPEEVIWPAIP
jgi:hypothetical protein